MIKPGDWIASIGRAKWYEPHLSALYAAINEYTRAKYPRRPWLTDPEWRMTHVRTPLPDGRIFEVTLPKARIISLKETKLDQKFDAGLVRVVRFRNAMIDVDRLVAAASEMEGTKYDLGDLADFGLSGLLGVFNRVIRIFGDKAGRFRVCSSGLSVALQRSGLSLPVSADSIDPSAPFNYFGLDPVAAAGQPWEPFDITEELTRESFRW